MPELQLHSLPTEKEYSEFLNHYDDVVVKSGGALQVLRNYEYHAVHGAKSQFEHIKRTGVVALELEPTHTNGRCIDPLMLATHAFKRGMLMGFEITSSVYSDTVPPDEIKDALKTGFRHEELGGQKGAELAEIPLLEWGKQGLDMMGEASRRVIRLWAEDVTNDDTLKYLFEYGVGAVVSTGEALVMNQSMHAIDAHFKRSDWSQELDHILTSNTGE
ncbi:MAG TPA: hypothetical protein VIM37_03050 [Candidatus Microsaccharimonas sp.]|jgi:hypothetical protein